MHSFTRIENPPHISRTFLWTILLPSNAWDYAVWSSGSRRRRLGPLTPVKTSIKNDSHHAGKQIFRVILPPPDNFLDLLLVWKFSCCYRLTCHGENTNNHSEVPTSNHGHLSRVISIPQSEKFGWYNTNSNDDQIKYNHCDKSFHVEVCHVPTGISNVTCELYKK